MKKNKKEPKSEPKTEEEKIIEALLGSEDEIIAESNLDEYLTESGIDPTSLVPDFKTFLERRAEAYHKQTGVVSQPLVAALRDVRSYQNNQNSPTMSPNSWIDNLLSGTLLRSPNQQFAYSFRASNGDDLSSKDKAILESLESEINDNDTTE